MNKLAISILKIHQGVSKEEALRLKQILEETKQEVKQLESQILNLISDVALIDETIEELEKGNKQNESTSKSKKTKRKG